MKIYRTSYFRLYRNKKKMKFSSKKMQRNRNQHYKMHFHFKIKDLKIKFNKIVSSSLIKCLGKEIKILDQSIELNQNMIMKDQNIYYTKNEVKFVNIKLLEVVE